jgi:hypothetical protein
VKANLNSSEVSFDGATSPRLTSLQQTHAALFQRIRRIEKLSMYQPYTRPARTDCHSSELCASDTGMKVFNRVTWVLQPTLLDTGYDVSKPNPRLAGTDIFSSAGSPVQSDLSTDRWLLAFLARLPTLPHVAWLILTLILPRQNRREQIPRCMTWLNGILATYFTHKPCEVRVTRPSSSTTASDQA